MIAIICAMDKERQSFIDALANKNEQLIMGYSFMTGQINGHDTVGQSTGVLSSASVRPMNTQD